jgi:N-methylhydantoinase A
MATATRMHLAERGRDPRRYDLIAFGGAGPVHAYGLARLLKLDRIVVPLGAGVTSALGFLVAPPAVDAVRSHVGRLDALDWASINALFAEMEGEARDLLLAAGTAADEIVVRRSADMRHVGQGFEIPVPLPAPPMHPGSVAEILEAFYAAYRQLFERTISDVPVEALSWRIEASGPWPDLELNFDIVPAAGANPEKGTRRVFFPETGFVESAVLDRYALPVGFTRRGPAVIEERESTTVVGPDATVSVDAHRNLVIDLRER